MKDYKESAIRGWRRGYYGARAKGWQRRLEKIRQRERQPSAAFYAKWEKRIAEAERKARGESP